MSLMLEFDYHISLTFVNFLLLFFFLSFVWLVKINNKFAMIINLNYWHNNDITHGISFIKIFTSIFTYIIISFLHNISPHPIRYFMKLILKKKVRIVLHLILAFNTDGRGEKKNPRTHSTRSLQLEKNIISGLTCK